MLKIFLYPSPILKKKAQEVALPDQEALALIGPMKQTMDVNNGIGLAAPQIGVSKRIIIVKDAQENHAFFNPVIVKESKEKEEDEEGCLSLPGVFFKVKRAQKVLVQALTLEGKEVRIEAQGLAARIFQHEVDHLNGKLIIHRAGLWARINKQWHNLAAVLTLLSLALYLAIQIAAPLYGQDKQRVFVVITQGQGTRAIAKELEKQQLIRSAWFFQGYALLKGVSHKLQAGEYDLSPSLSLAQILAKLATGDIAQETITIIEGWNIRDIARHLEGKGLFQATDVLEFAGSEGYLFPDTYRVRRGESLESVVKKMLANFEKKYSAELRAETKRQGKTIFQVITMASLIEREVSTMEDRQIVSGILWERLARGIALQVDATVDYATGKNNHISKEDLQIDSPYNTYKYAGLPLGPIANPGIESIKAALYPKASPYLYYLSTPQGKTIFSKTLEEHNIAKAKYLR